MAEKNPHRRIFAPIDAEGLITYFFFMPKISLVVCLHREKDLLERLLQHAQGCYDEIVVVHDGAESPAPSSSQTRQPSPEILSLSFPQAPPAQMAREYGELSRDSVLPPGYRLRNEAGATGTIQKLVQQYKGYFFEGPRCFQQEPHWPFAWWIASHDWILRLDADEYPSDTLRSWIQDFRMNPKPKIDSSGFTAIWPLWNGRQPCTRRWPAGRLFLFNKQKVSFVGMVEQTPVPDTFFLPTDRTLIHAPKRKSYGLRNIVFRKQAYVWRSNIARSLQLSPLLLPRWRFSFSDWPSPWREKLLHPVRSALTALFWYPLCQARDMLRWEKKVDLSACLNPGLHHFLMQIEIIRQKYRPSQ